MHGVRLATLTLLTVLATVLAALGDARAEPAEEKAKTAPAQPAWCAPDYDALADGICHVGTTAGEERRTLVIFLHGAIARNVTWQHLQERALARQAKQSHFEAIFPRAPLGPGGYVWPGTASEQEKVETELVSAWSQARRALEARNGRPFDDVFVMGFSSGAYFVASLALRGKLAVDGYATFAGGAGFGPPDGPARKPPVFVGVCAEDAQTAGHSRAFGSVLAARGFPHRVDEQPIGHMFGDLHVAHAVTWLRAQHAPPSRPPSGS
jgi:predicted esterase